jgi:hypothetical protein
LWPLPQTEPSIASERTKASWIPLLDVFAQADLLIPVNALAFCKVALNILQDHPLVPRVSLELQVQLTPSLTLLDMNFGPFPSATEPSRVEARQNVRADFDHLMPVIRKPGDFICQDRHGLDVRSYLSHSDAKARY